VDSIGKDIRIETKIQDRTFVLDKIIKRGTTVEVDNEIASFSADQIVNAQLDIKVIEKDLIFNDVGNGSMAIQFDSQSQITQELVAEIKVSERKRIFRKSTAVFILTFRVQVLGMRSYNSYSAHKDYNRYDTIIQNVVDYWNGEFLRDSDAPQELLDPNLVKAIIYQESRMGYDPVAGINVMQVGNQGDPSLKTLRGELPEYWIHNGKQQLLKYDAHVKEIKDSIYWGVRWLYHQAQGITNDNRRYWRTWREAVYRYGPNTQKYTNSVWNIYTKGIAVEKKNIIKLWTISVLFIFSALLLVGQNKVSLAGHDEQATFAKFFSNEFHFVLSEFLGLLFSGYSDNNWPAGGVRYSTNENKTEDLKMMIFVSLDSREQEQTEDIEITSYDQSTFLAIMEREKDWWEELRVGKRDHDKIKWLKIENPPTENSILSARWIKLKGFAGPILEVYGETHNGHGDLYLYQLNIDKLSLIFQTSAVDHHHDSKWHPQNYQKYGLGTCGETYTHGKLSATYSDINNDGVFDVKLTGIKNIICDQEYPNYNHQVIISEIPINLTYLLKPLSNQE